MKRLFLALLLVLACVSTARGQNVTPQARAIFATKIVAAQPGINEITGGIQYHQIIWTVQGAVSTCQVQVDTSADNVTWSAGAVISTQLCTSNGSSSVSSVVIANYVRVNVTTKTGTGTVTVTYLGWVASPAGGGGGGGSVTGCTTGGGVGFQNGTSNTLTCDATFVYSDAGGLYLKSSGSSAPSVNMCLTGDSCLVPEVYIYEDSSNNGYLAVTHSGSFLEFISGGIGMRLPTAAGTAGQVLSTDGGTPQQLSWANGSGIVGTCSTADGMAYYTATTTIGCDPGITTNTSGQLSVTGGFVAVSDGVHMGVSSLVGNTTNPVGFPFSNSWGFLPPASASFTSWYIQPSSATAPAANCLMQLGAVSNNINPLSCPTAVFTAQTDAATVTWAIASALNANATLTFTAHSGSRTLNITNPLNGGNYVIWLKQDGTGGEGLTLGTGCTWKVSGGGSGTITPSTGANAIDVLAFTYDGTNCYANFNKNFN